MALAPLFLYFLDSAVWFNSWALFFPSPPGVAPFHSTVEFALSYITPGPPFSPFFVYFSPVRFRTTHQLRSLVRRDLEPLSLPDQFSDPDFRRRVCCLSFYIKFLPLSPPPYFRIPSIFSHPFLSQFPQSSFRIFQGSSLLNLLLFLT